MSSAVIGVLIYLTIGFYLTARHFPRLYRLTKNTYSRTKDPQYLKIILCLPPLLFSIFTILCWLPFIIGILIYIAIKHTPPAAWRPVFSLIFYTLAFTLAMCKWGCVILYLDFDKIPLADLDDHFVFNLDCLKRVGDFFARDLNGTLFG